MAFGKNYGKHESQRVGIFVDVQNMYYSAKNLYDGAKVDFGEILKAAVSKRQLIRALAYVIRAEVGEEQAFYDALEKQGYEVMAKDLQVFAGGAKKGDWDVGMAVDAIRAADKLDTIVLVTGDGDFASLVDYLQNNKGCRVEVIAFGRTCSSKLVEEADDFLDLDENSDKFLIR
ncbi:MAG: NYN domain-containing protein [Patescibacteria group bacterium]